MDPFWFQCGARAWLRMAWGGVLRRKGRPASILMLARRISCSPGKPTCGLEPQAPSLRVKCSPDSDRLSRTDELVTPTLPLMQPSLDVGPSCLGDVDNDYTRPCASSCASRHRFQADLGALERITAHRDDKPYNDENPPAMRVFGS